MQEITCKAKLVAEQLDEMGYITYVFENLESTTLYDKYLMCVRFPNWNHNNLYLGDIGYVTLQYVKAGVDKWYDGNDFIDYKYSNVIFYRFIKEFNVDNTIILD